MKPVLSIATIVFCSCAPSPGPIKRQMIGLIEKFDRWDYNGNGGLEAVELKDAERLSGFTAPQIIDFYDSNGNGVISLREAQDGVSRLDEAKRIAAQNREER